MCKVSTPSRGATWLRPLDRRQHEARGGHLEGEALANQTVDLVLVVERQRAGDDAAGAVAEQIERQGGVSLPGDGDQTADVGDVLGDILDVEALALGPAAAAQIDSVGREARCSQLFAGPEILAAVRVHAMADHDDRARRSLRRPRAHVDPEPPEAREVLFDHFPPSAMFSMTPSAKTG
jgi:hypothetical protein